MARTLLNSFKTASKNQELHRNAVAFEAVELLKQYPVITPILLQSTAIFCGMSNTSESAMQIAQWLLSDGWIEKDPDQDQYNVTQRWYALQNTRK